MDNRRFAIFAGLGCGAVVLIAAGVVVALLVGLIPFQLGTVTEGEATISVSEVTREVAEAVPTLTPVPQETEGETEEETAQESPEGSPESQIVEGERLRELYEAVNPGVVNIRVYRQQAGMTGQGAGSGFVIDEDGHIVTNAHVVAEAQAVTVIFYDGLEVRAEVVGTDFDSDLAVVSVAELPEGVVPLTLAEIEGVAPGDRVVAIGNPFSLGGSMTLGIVSAIGRTIPTADTPFSIPQAVQTDASINPGNSGGPLLSLDGRVVGVNAQIASQSGTSSGVGFAIPSNVVRRVVPALIERGSYAWPWLGVQGGAVNLLLQEANDLDTQQGAYIAVVVDNGPAEEAGLRGATGEEQILGQAVPVGGDVVIEADGEEIRDFADLLSLVAFRRPGDSITLTILRDGAEQEVTVELAARPAELGP
jgi:2-alkenal reductase